MDPAAPLVVSEKEASRILAISVSALRKWRREQRGPAFIRYGRAIRYDLRALDRFVKLCSSPQFEPNSMRP